MGLDALITSELYGVPSALTSVAAKADSASVAPAWSASVGETWERYTVIVDGLAVGYGPQDQDGEASAKLVEFDVLLNSETGALRDAQGQPLDNPIIVMLWPLAPEDVGGYGFAPDVGPGKLAGVGEQCQASRERGLFTRAIIPMRRWKAIRMCRFGLGT